MNTVTQQHTPAILPVRFFALAFAISWSCWGAVVAANHGWNRWPTLATSTTILKIAACGPLIASFLLTYQTGGKAAVKRFAEQALRYRIPAAALCVALLLCPALAALASYLHSLEGGAGLHLNMPPAQIPRLFVLMLFLGGPLQEEFGWAYAIDRMQRRWSTLTASVLLGVIWGFWHLPLFFIPGTPQSSYIPFWSFLLLLVALRVIAVWIYNSSQQSILATILLHTSINLSPYLFPLLHLQRVAQRSWIYFCILAAIAALPVAWRQVVHARLAIKPSPTSSPSPPTMSR